MIVNEYNLVKIEADGDNLLTDSENTNTFKKVVCKQEEVSKYIEVSKEKANEIMQALVTEIKDTVSNIMDALADNISKQN